MANEFSEKQSKERALSLSKITFLNVPKPIFYPVKKRLLFRDETEKDYALNSLVQVSTYYEESFNTPRDWGIEDSVTIEEENYPLIGPDDMIFKVHFDPEDTSVHYAFIYYYNPEDCLSNIYMDWDGSNVRVTGRCSEEEEALLIQEIQAIHITISDVASQ